MANKNTEIKILQDIVTGLQQQSWSHRVHGKVFAAQGFSKLGEHYAEHAEEEMGWVEQFVDRIMDLGSTPEIQPTASGTVYEDIEEYLKAEKTVSEEGIAAVAQLMPAFADDFVTYDLVRDYLKDEDGDLQETNLSLELIERLGKQNWLIQQL